MSGVPFSFPINTNWNWLQRKENNQNNTIPFTPNSQSHSRRYHGWYYWKPLTYQEEQEWMFIVYQRSFKSMTKAIYIPYLGLTLDLKWSKNQLHPRKPLFLQPSLYWLKFVHHGGMQWWWGWTIMEKQSPLSKMNLSLRTHPITRLLGSLIIYYECYVP